MSNSFSILQSNLQELYALQKSVKNRKIKSKDLIADVWGRRIYLSKSHWGKLWAIIYRIIALFNKKAILQEQNLILALQYTERQFSASQEAVKISSEKFSCLLKDKCEDSPVNELTFNKLKWVISNWSDTCIPFLKQIQKHWNLKSLIRKYCIGHPRLKNYHLKTKLLTLTCIQVKTCFKFVENILQLLHKKAATFFGRSFAAPIKTTARKIHVFSKKFSSEKFFSSSCHNHPFSIDRTFSANCRLQKIIDLERYTQKPIPFLQLTKLSLEKNISAQDQMILEKWTQRLLSQKNQIPINLLHKSLKAFVSFLQIIDPKMDENFALETLEFSLAKMKLIPIFKQNDAKHITWRHRLKPGNIIKCNEKNITLGCQIDTSNESNQENIVFNCINDPNVVISIGFNKAILGIKRQTAKKLAWGIKSTKIIDIDSNGTCALMEKTFQPYKALHFTTKNGNLTPNDVDILKPIVNAIKWMLQENAIPSELNMNHLFFDIKGRLKTSKMNLPANFDYFKIEKFAKECSLGNQAAYDYIFHESKLSKHKYANYYKNVVKATSNGTMTDAASFAASYDIIDNDIIHQTQKLIDSTRANH